MLLVVTSPSYDDEHPADNTIATKMVGVAVAAASSGGGEVTFLAMTHFYGPFSLAGWGSGTGAAGLVGAGAYALATTGLGMSSRGTLFASAFLPFIMVGTFFVILPLGTLEEKSNSKGMTDDRHDARHRNERAAFVRDDAESDEGEVGPEDAEEEEEAGLLYAPTTSGIPLQQVTKPQPWTTTLRSNLKQMRHLFIP